MPNVTDSLDFILDFLPEIEHQLDRVAQAVHRIDVDGPQALTDAYLALSTVRADLHYAIARLGREHQALVVEGQLIRSLKCDNCLRFFEVTTGAAGTRRFCSPACKQAAYRARSDATALTAQITPR